MRESEIYYLFTNTRKRSSKKTILSSSHPRTRVKHQQWKRRSVVILDERSSFPRFTGGRLRSVTRFFLRVSLVRRPVEPVSIGRVESRRFFFLSLSLARFPSSLPPVALIRALVRPRWTHLLRSCRNRPLSRTTRVRVRPVDLNPLAFPRDISNPTLFHFCRFWCFRWRARGERFFFFFKFNLKFEILFEDGKKGFEKIESKSWKILFDGGKRGYLILERIWNSLFWSKFDSWIWEEFESYKYCWLNESRLLYFFSYNLVSKFLETLEIQNPCKT